jgi:hypothetical protein
MRFILEFANTVKTDSKADMSRSTVVDNHGQEQRVPGATSAYTLISKRPKRASRGVQLSPLKNVATPAATNEHLPLSGRAYASRSLKKRRIFSCHYRKLKSYSSRPILD